MGRYWESLPIHVGQQVHYKYVGIRQHNIHNKSVWSESLNTVL